MGISDFIKAFWWLMLIVVIGLVVGFNYLFKNNKQFHYQVHYLLLQMPIFGKLLQKVGNCPNDAHIIITVQQFGAHFTSTVNR